MSSSAQVNPFFAPTQISGCQLWLDAADTSTVLLSGSSVTQWNDKSGNGRNANQTTVSAQPTYANKTLSFTSSHTLVNTTFTGFTTAVTAYMVYYPTAAANAYPRALYLIPGATAWALFDSTQIGAQTSATGGYTIYGSRHLNQTYMVGITGTTGILPQYGVNGATFVNVANSYTQTQTTFGYNIGNSNVAAGTQYTGTINEIVVYNTLLSLSQRQQVEGYLAWKWGLQGSLPATHPYKSSPIPPLLSPPTTIPSSVQNLQSTWSPLQISGCALWLDAGDSSTLTLSGSSVTQWRDKSGSNYSASPTTASFTSSNTVLIGSSGLTFSNFTWRTKFTSFFVSKGGIYTIIDTRPTTNGIIYVFTANYSLEVVYSPAGGTIEMKDTLLAQGTSVVDPNVFSLLTTGYNNGTTVTPYAVNGSPRASVATNGTSASDAYLTKNLIFNNMANTEIAESLIYNTNLTNSQYQQIEGYLAWKWKLQGLLPPSHPYKSGPPFVPTFVSPTRSIIQTAGWNPTKISGCSLWLDATDSSTLILSGSSVIQWNDKSGNGRNATAPISPTLVQGMQNKLPAIYFNSFSYFTGSLTNTTNQQSFFSVFRYNTGAPQYARLASFGVNNIADFSNISYYNMSYNTGTLAITRNSIETGVTLLPPALDTFHQASVIFNGTNGLYYTEGGTYANSAAWTANFNFNQYRLGSDQTPFQPQQMIGYIGEVIVYSGGVTTQQRQQVEGYLAWKWGLQKSLPGNHPWANWPPPPS